MKALLKTNYAISAFTYISGKYDNIDEGEPLTERRISLLYQPKNPPDNLTAKDCWNNTTITEIKNNVKVYE